MKPFKNAIAFVIYNQDRSEFLIVKRPSDDADLPNVWGLPAGSVKDGESFQDAVYRSGKEKLGVGLEIIKKVNEGELERERYILHMQEFEVAITKGDPLVPQLFPAVTQYAEWRWGTPDDVREAAQKGSLCSRLYLQSISKDWKL